MTLGIVDVLGSGAVVLGPRVTCDGFHAERAVRIQTHIHTDHMAEFTTSLRGTVIMTEATRDLLAFEHPALPARVNVKTLGYGESWVCDGQRYELYSSQHMLGAAQAKVTLEDGATVGYSGDFCWPLEDVIKVDALVVDATYGDPDSGERCAQAVAQEALVRLIRNKLRRGAVHLMADTGPLDRGLLSLAMTDVLDGVPVIGNARTCWHTAVNRRHSLPLPNVIRDDTAEAHDAMRVGSYVRIWSLHSPLPNDGLYDGAVIRLTKYRTGREPFEEVGNEVFNVGLSNHADFDGTLRYIEATGARYVVTDNHRGQRNDRAAKLAEMVRKQLKVEARVSSNHESRLWGH
jgi:putative mRNA 3-end processing factor